MAGYQTIINFIFLAYSYSCQAFAWMAIKGRQQNTSMKALARRALVSGERVNGKVKSENYPPPPSLRSSSRLSQLIFVHIFQCQFCSPAHSLRPLLRQRETRKRIKLCALCGLREKYKSSGNRFFLTQRTQRKRKTIYPPPATDRD